MLLLLLSPKISSTMTSQPCDVCTHRARSVDELLAVAVVALDDGAADGEALAGLQLSRQVEEVGVARLLRVVVAHLHQHQDLRPASIHSCNVMLYGTIRHSQSQVPNDNGSI